MGLIADLLSGGKKSSNSAPNRIDTNTSASMNNPYPTVGESSSLPPYGKTSSNRYDEDRSLPPGWSKQWSEEHRRYFYVDSNSINGPQSHWIHPSEMNIHPSRGRVSNFVDSSYAQDPRQQPYGQQSMYQQVPAQMSERRSDGRGRKSGMNPMMAGAGGLAGGMLLGSMLEGNHERREGYEQGYENGHDDDNRYDNRNDDDDRYDNGNDGGGMFGGSDDFGGDF